MVRRLVTITVMLICIGGVSGCYVRKVGALSVLSPRPIDSTAHYAELARNVGGTRSEVVANRSSTIEDATEKLLNSVPGGHYLTNVSVYLINRKKVAVSGDIWGTPGRSSNQYVYYRDRKGLILVTPLTKKGRFTTVQFPDGKLKTVVNDALLISSQPIN